MKEMNRWNENLAGYSGRNVTKMDTMRAPSNCTLQLDGKHSWKMPQWSILPLLFAFDMVMVDSHFLIAMVSKSPTSPTTDRFRFW